MKVREEIESIHKEFEKINEELQKLREATGVAIRRHDFLRGKLEVLAQLEANGTKQEG